MDFFQFNKHRTEPLDIDATYEVGSQAENCSNALVTNLFAEVGSCAWVTPQFRPSGRNERR